MFDRPPTAPGVRRETHPTPDPRDHYAELDALRGIAIFAVFMTHLSGYWGRATGLRLDIPWIDMNFLQVFRYGYLGVPLFFLLSGYLLTWTEEKRRDQGSYSLFSYAKRRAFRLVPAYYAAIVLIILLRPNDPSTGSVALHLSFLHGLSPAYPGGLDPVFWSLTPEVIFYASLPLLVLVFRGLWQRLVILAGLVLVSLGAKLYMANGLSFLGEDFGGTRLYFFPTTLLYIFLVGMLLRMMVERMEAANGFPRWRRPVALICTVAPAALIVFPYYWRQPEFLRSPVSMAAEVLVILFFAAVLLGSPIMKSVTRWRPLTFFGKISYSVFLLHTTVIFLLFRYVLVDLRPWLIGLEGVSVWAAFTVYGLVALAATTVVSYLSFRFIESPFLQRKPK